MKAAVEAFLFALSMAGMRSGVAQLIKTALSAISAPFRRFMDKLDMPGADEQKESPCLREQTRAKSEAEAPENTDIFYHGLNASASEMEETA